MLGCGSTGAVKKMGEPGELTEGSFPENRLTIPEKFPNIYIDITGEEEEQYADFSVPRERAEGGRPLRKTAEPALEPLCQSGKYPCGTARTRR